MKKYIISACLVAAIAASGYAQNKPAVKAKGPVISKNKGEAHIDSLMKIQNSDVKSFEVDGIRVVLKPTVNEVISAELFISGGVRNYSLEKQGVENLMVNVMADQGSQKYPKDNFHDLMEQNGIAVSGSAGADFSNISLRTLSMNWGQAWDMFQDVITHPSWDQSTFEETRGRTMNGLSQQEADPDAYLGLMVTKGIYKGLPYEKRAQGNSESVKKLSLDDLKAHYANVMKRKKMVLVIVGKVSEKDLRDKIHASFASLAEGVADPFVSNPVAIASNSFNAEQRDIATNYVRGVFSAPKAGTREASAMRMGVAILAERLFVEIRTKRNLSYAPSASMSSSYDPYSSVYVSTLHPNDAAQVMMDEIRKIKKEGFNQKELDNEKETFLTGYYMQQETNAAQAYALGAAELMNRLNYATMFKETIYSLSLEEVNAAFRKYASHMQWFYLGKKDQADEKVFTRPLE